MKLVKNDTINKLHRRIDNRKKQIRQLEVRCVTELTGLNRRVDDLVRKRLEDRSAQAALDTDVRRQLRHLQARCYALERGTPPPDYIGPRS